MKNFFVGLAFTHQLFFKKNKINLFKPHTNELSFKKKFNKNNLFLHQPTLLFFFFFKINTNIFINPQQGILVNNTINWSDFFAKSNKQTINGMCRVFKYSFKNNRSKLKRKYFYIFRRLQYVWEKHFINPEKTYLFAESDEYTHSLEFLFPQTFKFKFLNLAKMIFNFKKKTKIKFKGIFKIKKPKFRLLFNNLKSRTKKKNNNPCKPYFYQIHFIPATVIKTPWKKWKTNKYFINLNVVGYYSIITLNLKINKKKKIWSTTHQKELFLTHLKKKYYAYYLHKTFDRAYNYYWELQFFKKNLFYLNTLFKNPTLGTAKHTTAKTFNLEWVYYYSTFLTELLPPIPSNDPLRFFEKTTHLVFFPTFYISFLKKFKTLVKIKTKLNSFKQTFSNIGFWGLTFILPINSCENTAKKAEFFAESGLYFSLLWVIADVMEWGSFKPTMGPEDIEEPRNNFLKITFTPIIIIFENNIICRWFFKNLYFLTQQTKKLLKHKLIRKKWFKPYKKKFKQAHLIPMRKKKKLISSFAKHFLIKPLNESLKNYFKFFFNLENQFFKKNSFITNPLLDNENENFENSTYIFENSLIVPSKSNFFKNQFSNSLTLSNYNPVFFLPNIYKNSLFEKTHRLVTKLNTKFLQNYLNNFVSNWITLKSLIIVQNNLSLKNFVFVDSLDIIITELVAYFIRLNVRFFKRFPITEFVEFFTFSSFKKDLTFFKNFFTNFVGDTHPKVHKKIFSSFDFMLKKFLYKIMLWSNTKGIKFEVAGKISVTGNAKKRRKIVRLGNYSLTSKHLKIDFVNDIINTPTGVLGYKIFITW